VSAGLSASLSNTITRGRLKKEDNVVWLEEGIEARRSACTFILPPSLPSSLPPYLCETTPSLEARLSISFRL